MPVRWGRARQRKSRGDCGQDGGSPRGRARLPQEAGESPFPKVGERGCQFGQSDALGEKQGKVSRVKKADPEKYLMAPHLDICDELLPTRS